MFSSVRSFSPVRSVALFASLALSSPLPVRSLAQSPAAGAPSAVLVELFTSEGCSSCPPADALLRQITGHKTPQGQLIVGLSEHISYWDGLGWKDPYSSEVYTRRQDAYGAHFGLPGVYTPQMVVNGREQLVGSDAHALQAAFASEWKRPAIALRITSAQASPGNLTFTYAAGGFAANSPVQLFAVLADDADRSSVLRGENSGRELIHASVARLFAPLGALRQGESETMTLPLPPSLAHDGGAGHHLVVFAQQKETLAVLGVDTRPF